MENYYSGELLRLLGVVKQLSTIPLIVFYVHLAMGCCMPLRQHPGEPTVDEARLKNLIRPIIHKPAASFFLPITVHCLLGGVGQPLVEVAFKLLAAFLQGRWVRLRHWRVHVHTMSAIVAHS